jgi:hypothetical protein
MYFILLFSVTNTMKCYADAAKRHASMLVAVASSRYCLTRFVHV